MISILAFIGLVHFPVARGIDRLPVGSIPGEISFCPSQPLMAQARLGGPICLYRNTSAGWQLTHTIPAKYPFEIQWGLSGRTLGWLEDEGRLAVWRRGRIHYFHGNNSSNSRHDVCSYSFSPDESMLAVGRLDSLELIDLNLGKSMGYRHKGAVTSVSYDRFGHLFAGGQELFEAPSRSGPLVPVSGSSKWIGDVAVSPDDRSLAVLAEGRGLALYTVHSQKWREHIWRGRGRATELVWSPNGRFVAIVVIANQRKREPTSWNRIVILDSSTWKEVRTIHLPSWSVGNPSFNYGGSLLSVEIDGEKSVVETRVWSTVSWKPVDLIFSKMGHRGGRAKASRKKPKPKKDSSE